MNWHREHVWEYLGEVVVSMLLLIAFNLLIGIRDLGAWLNHKKPDLANLLIVGAAATAVTFGAFFAVLTTDFGLKLRLTGEARSYIVAFGFPLILFVSTLALLTLGDSSWGWLYSEAVILLLIYSSLNLVTMIKNVIDLGGLWQDVDRARKYGKR